MNIKLLLILFFASVWYAYVEAVGGGLYIPITEAPYYVGLGNTYYSGSFCGSAILSEYWIITAAHCIEDHYNQMEVHTGKSTKKSAGIVHTVEKIIIHSDYEKSASEEHKTFLHNDIALLKLKEPIQFNEYRQPIKISSNPVKDLDKVTIVGLGYVKDTTDTVPLKKTEMTITLSTEEYTVPTMIVMKDNYTEACVGDSGSPISRNGQLVGVLSMVRPCRDWDSRHYQKSSWITPTYLYYDWIIKYTGLNY